MKYKYVFLSKWFAVIGMGISIVLMLIAFLQLENSLSAYEVNDIILTHPIVAANTGKIVVTNYDIHIKKTMYLKIPKIGINVPISHIGLTDQWAMGSPKSYNDVVWFDQSPRPWEVGSAVLAGHYGIRKNGSISIFQDLGKLKPGDKIYIINGKDKVISFVVTKISTYDFKASTTEVFVSNDGKAHLNLITCIWDSVSASYSKRLVVFTDRE